MKLFQRRRLGAIAVAATSAVVLAAGGAIAATSSFTGGAVTRTAILTQDSASTHSGTTATTLGTVSINVDAGATVLVTFSAESACTGVTGYCTARILFDGSEASPVAGNDFAFDSTNNGTETATSWEAHSMQRVATALMAGTYTVEVEVRQSAAGVTARYDDWTLTAMAIAP